MDFERTWPRWELFPEAGGGPPLEPMDEVPETRLLPPEAETGPFPPLTTDNLVLEAAVLIEVADEALEELDEELCRRVGRSGGAWCCSISATVGRPWPSRLNFSVPAARLAEERRLDGLEVELLEEEEKAPVPGPKAKVELVVDAESRDIFFQLYIYIMGCGNSVGDGGL